jgi:hypothetical protein
MSKYLNKRVQRVFLDYQKIKSKKIRTEDDEEDLKVISGILIKLLVDDNVLLKKQLLMLQAEIKK